MISKAPTLTACINGDTPEATSSEGGLTVMRHEGIRSQKGYTLVELLVVVAVIGIMAFIAVPWMLSYIPGATVNYAAREVQGSLNRAKLLAVSTRQLICVKPAAGGYQFWTGVTATCGGGAPLTGQPVTGSNAQGTFTLANSISVTLVTTNPVFNQFGMATQGGQFRVTGTSNLQQTVSVQPSGRVTIP